MRRNGYVTSFLIGVILLAAGIPISLPPSAANLLIAVGGGLIAAAVVAYLAIPRDELADELWELGVIRLLVNRSELTDDDYVRLVTSARQQYRALGTANHGYINTETAKAEFQGAFMGAAARGVKIEIIYLKPDGDLVKHRSSEEGRNTKKDALESIKFFSGLRSELPKHKDNIKLLEYDLTPSCGIVWADDHVVVSHYMPARANVLAPGIVLRATNQSRWLSTLPWVGRSTKLTRVYTGMYEQVRGKATEMSEQRISQLLSELPVLTGVSEAEIRHHEVDKESQ
jgi:hypothetical protein